jgi:lysophospholipase L1-like esterase
MQRLAVLAAAWLVVTTAAVFAQDNPAATPSPRKAKDGQPEKGWMGRHEGFVKIATKGDVDLLFVGDSITDGWRNQKAWKYFEAFKPANFGIGGDRTEHVLWRLQNGELDNIKPKAMVLMIGTNNVGANKAEQISEGIEAIVKHVRKTSPDTKILLLAVFPRGEKAEKNPAREKINAINKTIAKLDDGKNVKYLDIGNRFLKEDGTLTKDIMYDFLHLTPAGYEIWAQAILPTVTEMVGKK